MLVRTGCYLFGTIESVVVRKCTPDVHLFET